MSGVRPRVTALRMTAVLGVLSLLLLGDGDQLGEVPFAGYAGLPARP